MTLTLKHLDRSTRLADIQARKNLPVNLAACHLAEREAAGPEILGESARPLRRGEEPLRQLVCKIFTRPSR
jgi:hypothetical protein